MPYEICFAPSDWHEECVKVTNAYKGSNDVCIIFVKYKIVEKEFYRLPEISDKLIAKALSAQDPEFSKKIFKTPFELRKWLSEKIGLARSNRILSAKKILPNMGKSVIADETYAAIADVITSKKGEWPRHIRWFGHGNKGCVIGAEKTRLHLGCLVNILLMTRSPKLSLYCCHTGHPGKDMGMYNKSDAPKWILKTFHANKNYSLGTACVIINSSVTEVMWSGDKSDKDREFFGDRHTYMDEACSIRECTEHQAKDLNLFQPNLRQRRGLPQLSIST